MEYCVPVPYIRYLGKLAKEMACDRMYGSTQRAPYLDHLQKECPLESSNKATVQAVPDLNHNGMLLIPTRLRLQMQHYL